MTAEFDGRSEKSAGHGLADLPLYLKGLIVVAIPLAALVVVTVSLYFMERENQEAERWVRQTLRVGTQIQMVHTAVEEAETGMGGYLLTRQPAWLKPYNEARRDLPILVQELEEMLRDNPSQLARVREVKAAADELLKILATLPERHGRGEAQPAAGLVESKARMDRLRSDLEEMRFEQQRQLSERTLRANKARERSYALISAGVVLAPLGGILAMLLFTAGVARRVERLEDNARRLARGEPLAPMVSGRDEIGRLEQSLADAASLLAAREQELRKARDQLEARVSERTAELARANRALQAEIGERKRAEEDLSQANDTLHAVIQASPLAIIGLDLQGNVKSWNRAAEQMFGWSEAEVVGRLLPTVPEQDYEEFRTLMEAAAHGQMLTGLERRRRCKDGSMMDVRIWTSPLRDATGTITGMIAVMADFTERKRLEEQLIQAQKMEAVGRLAGGVAHDFNNLLTVISGYGHMLVNGVRSNEPLRGFAEEVLKASERAARLTSQLLAFSRRQAIQPKIMDLNSLVANMEKMLSRVIGEDIELKTVLRPNLWPVQVDPGRIEQVIMNLAVNARDAMPNGGRLTIETSNVDLGDASDPARADFRSGPHVMIAVTDTGHGMDAQTKSHLFEPFFTTKEKGRGTGLGLSTVYGIVKQHGGDIWVYSEPGRGTTFKIYLPPAREKAESEQLASARARPLRGSETILLAEDEEGVRKLVREVLELRGYRVLEAGDGPAAIELARTHAGPIDLLLTDVVMPQMSGSEVAENLRRLRPEVKVLFLSGYTDHVVIDHGVVPVGADFLEKPFTPDVLAQKVRSVLDGPTQRRYHLEPAE